ncbi:MAG: hypothetical protein M1838_005201 [Thelocarpon superellum]|nr:MAG: hypothetical protein M1838_005201 [Thelocarpon superellum]
MSYAQAAAKGPKQSPEECILRACCFYRSAHGLLPLTRLTDSRAPAPPQVVHSDVDTESLVDVDSPHVNTVPSDYESQSVKTSTQANRLEHEAADKERATEQELKHKHHEAKEKAKKAGKKVQANADNPVVIGNAVVVAALSAALGFGAYRKYAAGELSWGVVGFWTGAVGLFAAGDYYLSQYLFQTKYPRK